MLIKPNTALNTKTHMGSLLTSQAPA
ncbi:hypothetical protein BC938DRAFT_477414 [Jimgerdemannia flammicorona]|uniref:Uncharacterized protein n=1 Tax=Jimgerdemannia flammicorona TaxID=994334 RepID=A0A433QYV3_9FUNG|nr:hypothetical protein BC938DRAFT_477414 [Jimgerdemannia flammicorona]